MYMYLAGACVTSFSTAVLALGSRANSLRYDEMNEEAREGNVLVTLLVSFSPRGFRGKLYCLCLLVNKVTAR